MAQANYLGCYFVADGCQRARAASEPLIRAEVAREFADRLAAASLDQAERIRIEIERETQRRLERIAPADALY